jgi:hypothetical protein
MGMPKAVRIGLKVLAVLVVVLVVLVIGLILFLGPIIKTAAEKLGPKVLGVPVQVEKVSVSVFGGSFGLKGVRVGNPEGYSQDPAFALGELRVAVALGSLPGSGPIVVKEVTILAPEVSYEVVKGVSNVDAMLKHAQGGKPAAEKEAPATPAKEEAKPAAKEEAKPARKVIIERFSFHEGQLSYRSGLTLHKAIRLPLPGVEAKDIGKESDGTSIEEATGRMFMEVISSIGRVVEKAGDVIGKGAKAGAEAVKDVGKGAVDAIKSLF